MICIRCKTEVPDGKHCINCGAKQVSKAYRRMRSNGMGTAYKRNRTWTASVTIAWHDGHTSPEEEAHLMPVKRTKGGFKTKSEALAYCQQLLKRPAADHRDTTIKALNDTFLITRYKKLSPSKQTAYKIAYNKIKAIHFTPIVDLSVSDLQHLIDGLSYYPARDIKVLLSHLYKLACAQQDTTANLAQFMVLPELHETSHEPFTDDELKKLWSAYSDGDTWIGYILLMIYSGMMPGELLNCKKSMIDLAGRTIIGAGLKTKERKAKPIVIADFIVPVIESLMELSDTDKFIRINKDYFYDAYYAKLAACGCRKLPPYSCRHTTGTALSIGKNIAPAIIQRIMRHTKFTSTERYIHPSNDDSLIAINKLDPSVTLNNTEDSQK